MRLIDADELIEDIKVERVNLFMEGLRGTPRSYEYLNQLQDKLEDAETVDAIPIEWIENHIKQLKHELHEYRVKNLGMIIGFETYKKSLLLESLEIVLDTWRSEVK